MRDRPFIDDVLKLDKRIFRFSVLAPPYDGVSMFLCHRKLNGKILSITIDNDTYNDVMMTTLKNILFLKAC